MTTEEEMIIAAVEQKSYPRFLNKYRSDGENTRKILTDNELWFSNPLIFNDPYDCNTPIHKDTSLDNIKKWLISLGIPEVHVEGLAKELKENPNLMEEKTKGVISNTGICCFSTLDDSILQWSHYSDYHRGVCLKFDITKDPSFFLIPLIVSYKNIMQHYNHFTQSEKILEYLIQSKFSAWSYESEVRIIKTVNNMYGNNGNRAFKFKDEALTEVIFGTSTPDSVIEEYKDLCKNYGKTHVNFYKMSLGDGVHYELVKKYISLV